MGDQLVLKEWKKKPAAKKKRCKQHAWSEWKSRQRISTRMCRSCPEVETRIGSSTVTDELTDLIHKAVARRLEVVSGRRN